MSAVWNLFAVVPIHTVQGCLLPGQGEFLLQLQYLSLRVHITLPSVVRTHSHIQTFSALWLVILSNTRFYLKLSLKNESDTKTQNWSEQKIDRYWTNSRKPSDDWKTGQGRGRADIASVNKSTQPG